MENYVYCSGPMFSPEELATMATIAKTLENEGFKTYLPQRDGIEVAKIMNLINQPLVSGDWFKKIMKIVRKAIFALDIFQLVDRCPFLVFNLDGRVPDEGSVVETAIGFAAGKPLIIYKNDPRTVFAGEDNPMITGLSYTFSYVNAIKDIPRELNTIIDKLKNSGRNPYQGDGVPPEVKKIVNKGRLVWEILQLIRWMEHKESDLYGLVIKLVEELEKRDEFGK